MPIDELGVSVIGALFRFLGWLLVEIFLEVLVKGLGYLICRPFKKVKLDSTVCAVWGIVAWVLIIVLVVWFAS